VLPHAGPALSLRAVAPDLISVPHAQATAGRSKVDLLNRLAD
jgi:hypothetical protein